MQKVLNAGKRLWKARAGQDLVEYALMAASVAVAAGVFFPPAVMPAVSGIFEKISSMLTAAPL